jgi:hypothetical protein
VVTICTASLTFNNSTFCPHSVFMCFVWIWEQTAIISLYSINWLVCITETECVYCAVRTGSLYPTHVNPSLQCLNIRGITTDSNKMQHQITAPATPVNTMALTSAYFMVIKLLYAIFMATQRKLCAVCCVLCAVCYTLCAVCCVLYAGCCVLCAVCCVLYAVCCVLYAVCCVLYAVCCVLCAVCCQQDISTLCTLQRTDLPMCQALNGVAGARNKRHRHCSMQRFNFHVKCNWHLIIVLYSKDNTADLWDYLNWAREFSGRILGQLIWAFSGFHHQQRCAQCLCSSRTLRCTFG